MYLQLSFQLQWVPGVSMAWVLLLFLFFVNDGSKSTSQYKGEHQHGGQSNCWNFGQFKDSLKVYNWDKFIRSIRQRNN